MTGQPVGTSVPVGVASEESVRGVAFSPNGQVLATADADGTVRSWGVWQAAEDPYDVLCAEVGPPTTQTWEKYASRESRPKVC